MSKAKAVSTIINNSLQKSSAHSSIQRRHVCTYFTTNNKNKCLIQNPGLKFNSVGFQEENKKWGLLWTMERNKAKDGYNIETEC